MALKQKLLSVLADSDPDGNCDVFARQRPTIGSGTKTPIIQKNNGGVAEWLKAPVLKTGDR